MERIDEARSAGAEAIISCCPFCESNFEKAIHSSKGTIRYHDLTELVSKML
jgi:Fe-S oxidoreductase